jgi:L-malate glycosyltransferase
VKLKAELEDENIKLDLIYGKNLNNDALKLDEVDIEWAKYIPNRRIKIGKIELLWQPCLKYLKDYDLIISEQANKLLINYYLSLSRKFVKYKFAFWGHGRNMQDSATSLKNRFKYLFINKCDWWFAYTEGVKKVMINNNYPQNKITVVQNAIDTISLQKYYNDITSQQISELKKYLNIESDNVAIYCGGIYAEKRIDFIINACIAIRKVIPDFHMIIIGSGIETNKVKKASETYNWIHYEGPKFDEDRVIYFKISKVQLMPGLVGLGILDSFALQTPIVTTNFPFHSPEFSYLVNGENGIITADSFE